ncbi:hypothetical protein QDW41_gp41 [Microbacterium phage QMacho]|uniref:hypothetical protein n=1 Tax=Microbacterium phage QMacho TaxID=2985325 RepID=UPI00242F02D7|nr:hypothetical protein QDW41_gp41 [Microbacterium phage QMacho]UYL86698.1 hypothetical protein SEA_QMACHO_41 [Microbacterium phage QMacho]
MTAHGTTRIASKTDDVRGEALSLIEQHYTGADAELGRALAKLFRTQKTVIRVQGDDQGVIITEDARNN